MESAVYRRERIVSCAIDLIHEVGLHFLSTKVLAERVGMAESTLFKLFPKKTDILAAVLDQLTLYDAALFQTAHSKDPRSVIPYYIDTYMTYYENYPAITAVLQADELFRGIPDLEDRAKRLCRARWEYILDLIELGQSAGVIDRSLNSRRLADIFHATFNQVCTNWRLGYYDSPLREEARQTFELLLIGVASDKTRLPGQ